MQSYLAAKRSLDDRALNRRVLDRFEAELGDRTDGDPVRVVEPGAGIGTMVARLAAWDRLPERVSYRLVDSDADSVAYAREHLPGWLADAGYRVERTDDALLATEGDRRLSVTFDVADALAVTDDADAVIASAFLDLFDPEDALPPVLDLLAPGGLLYAPITFDGRTAFAPAHPLDDAVERAYHRHMDELRDEGGGSDAGHRLLTALPAAGAEVVAAGGSDWIVRPENGGYPGEEAALLRHVLETIDGALDDYPGDEFPPSERTRWVEARREQVAAGDLVYVAHNLDVLARA